MTHRAVITGIGAVTAAGTGIEALREALWRGVDCLSPITGFDTGGFAARRGGVVATISGDTPNRGGRLLADAFREALGDAGCDTSDIERIYLGTAHGPLDDWEQIASGGYLSGSGECGHWGLLASLGGVNCCVTVISNACTSSSTAVALAADAIRSGAASIAVAAGADTLTEFVFAGFDSLRALSPTVCKPFDRRRDGVSLGEGAGVVVLEDERRARARGVRPYCAVDGYGLTADGGQLTAPDPVGKRMGAAISAALDMGGASPPEIGYVSMHGTGTVLNDRAELRAVRRIFGTDAPPPLSSIKSMLGHTSGAAGALEIVQCALSFRDETLPPTLNFENTEREFEALDIIREAGRRRRLSAVISINNAFGGSNSALLLRGVN